MKMLMKRDLPGVLVGRPGERLTRGSVETIPDAVTASFRSFGWATDAPAEPASADGPANTVPPVDATDDAPDAPAGNGGATAIPAIPGRAVSTKSRKS